MYSVCIAFAVIILGKSFLLCTINIFSNKKN